MPAELRIRGVHMIVAREPVTAENLPPIPGDLIRRKIGAPIRAGVLDGVPGRTIHVTYIFG